MSKHKAAIIVMRANPRSKEDALTVSLANALRDPDVFVACWKATAPAHLHRVLPGRVEVFSRLGATRATSKPDIIFYSGDTPTLYVEAKLACQTEPLQLTRARFWMRAAGARDDQILLLSQFKDELPGAVGWRGPALPVRTILWQELEQHLREQCIQASKAARDAVALFSAKLNDSSRGATCKNKRGLLFKSGHRYGEVMFKLAETMPEAKAEFLYGARIDPRLCLGRTGWRAAFGTADVERLRIAYGPERVGSEFYRAQFLLWQTSDIAGSLEAVSNNWSLWRNAIVNDPVLEFDFGVRQSSHRGSALAPPRKCPQSMQGLVKLKPSARVYESEIRFLDCDQLLLRLQTMIQPLETLVESVLKRL